MYIVTYSRHFFFCFYIFILKFKIHRKVVKVALETPLYLSLSLPIVTILPHLPYSLYTLKDQDIRGMMSATFFSDGLGKNFNVCVYKE